MTDQPAIRPLADIEDLDARGAGPEGARVCLCNGIESPGSTETSDRAIEGLD